MQSKRVVFIVAHQGFQPIEYHEPKKIVEKAGFQVTTASNKGKTATDSAGGTTPVDTLVSHIQVADYDGIFFMGGPGALDNLDNNDSYRVIKEAQQHHKIIGAICIATRILAKANALTRKRATGWDGDHELKKIYEAYDVIYLAEPVVVTDNIITAVGPSAAKTFGQEIVNLLKTYPY